MNAARAVPCSGFWYEWPRFSLRSASLAASPGTEVGAKLGFWLGASRSAAAPVKQESDLGSDLFGARRGNSSRCST